ncbi:MAG: FGGY family carbohydrate kinase, partial [Spirochaetota bacterium]
MNGDLILSIDVGTQSVRAILFDAAGSIVAKEKIEYEPYYSDNPGWAEQNPEVYWSGICHAIQKLKSSNRKKFTRIKAVVPTVLRDTAVNVDKKGKALRSAMIWLDQRHAEYENHLY